MLAGTVEVKGYIVTPSTTRVIVPVIEGESGVNPKCNDLKNPRI